MIGEWDGVPSAVVEVKALESIYMDELQVDLDEDGACSSVALWLYPATADKVEEQYVRIFLKIKLPKNYPEYIPEVCISNPRGLSDEQTNRITEKLLSIAENSKGSAMLYELIQAAKEQLTAENRPNEDCAICLYGFRDEDVFTKTECYHYYHSHCLSRYVKSKLVEENDEPSGSDEVKQKPVCPVCRVPISFSSIENDYPEPVETAAATVSLDVPHKQPPDMEKLYQKQLAQGGIIDVEAEKNKFLLEIANVPTMTESKDSGILAGEASRNDSSIDKLEDEVNEQKKHSPTSSPSIRYSYSHRNRGGYRPPYRKKNDFREPNKYAHANQCQSNRSHFNSNPGGRYNQESNRQEQQQNLEESSNHEPLLNNSEDTDRMANDDNHHQVPDAARNHRPRGYGHQSGYKNSHNHQQYKPFHNYNNGFRKSQGVDRRRGGGRAYDFPNHTHSRGGSTDAGEKYDGRKNAEEEEELNPESSDHAYKPKPVSEHFNRRPNFRSGPKFQGRRNYQQPRYWKNHEPVPNDSRERVYNVESSPYDRKVNPWPNKPNFHDMHRQRNSDGNLNYNSRNKDQMPSNRFQQSHSPRYQGNSYSGNNRRWKEQDRNRTFDFKSSLKGRDSEESSRECEDVRQNLSKVHIDTKSLGRVKSQENSTKVSDGLSKSMEKCASVLRPPPGFANPLKKVVYGLPSLNPPPGFGSS